MDKTLSPIISIFIAEAFIMGSTIDQVSILDM